MEAQSALTISAGASVPIASAGDNFKNGYNAMLAVDTKLPFGPFGMRIEGFYSEMRSRTVGETSRRIIGGIADLTLSGGSLYFIGGLGIYNWGCAGSGCPASNNAANDIGVNLGLGYVIPLGGFATIIEARVHRLVNNTDSMMFVPLSFG